MSFPCFAGQKQRDGLCREPGDGTENPEKVPAYPHFQSRLAPLYPLSLTDFPSVDFAGTWSTKSDLYGGRGRGSADAGSGREQMSRST